MNFQTADLCDAHPERVSIAEPLFRDFGGKACFHGPMTTVRCPGDNTAVKAALREAGGGRVLVVDGGGLLNFSLLGDNLGKRAVENGWAGLVIYGCVRDSEILATLDVGVKALATCPLKTVNKAPGERDVSVHFAGVDFLPGHYLYADRDGIIVSAERIG